jgi:hypothetical protein
MEAAGIDLCAEARNIQFMITERIEAQGKPIADQAWLRAGIGRLQRFPQVRPGDAQIVLRGRSRQVGPQQAQQKFTAVLMIRLDQEIGQQSDHLTVGEDNGSQPAMLDLQSTQ